MKKSVEPLKDYHFIKIKTQLDVGRNYSLVQPLCAAFSLGYVYNVVNWIIFCQKPYVKFDNNIRIYEDEDVFELYFRASVIFNLLMIILSIVKILVGKMAYANK